MRLKSKEWHALARGLAASIVALGALAWMGCAHVPVVGGKPTFKLALQAAPTLNNCGKSTAYPLHYRILQVTDAKPLAGMKLERLWDKEQEMLGGALVWRGPEVVVEPNARKEEAPVPLDPRATAVVVLGNFCKTSGSCFYYVQPVAGKKVALELTADATCLKATKR